MLERTVVPGDVVLLKSSRDAGLREIAAPLIDHLQRRDGALPEHPADEGDDA